MWRQTWPCLTVMVTRGRCRRRQRQGWGIEYRRRERSRQAEMAAHLPQDLAPSVEEQPKSPAQSSSRRNRQRRASSVPVLAGNKTDTGGRAGTAICVGGITKYLSIASLYTRGKSPFASQKCILLLELV
jgi:hypothetical protein